MSLRYKPGMCCTVIRMQVITMYSKLQCTSLCSLIKPTSRTMQTPSCILLLASLVAITNTKPHVSSAGECGLLEQIQCPPMIGGKCAFSGSHYKSMLSSEAHKWCSKCGCLDDYPGVDDDEKMFPSIANTQTSFARQEIIN